MGESSNAATLGGSSGVPENISSAFAFVALPVTVAKLVEVHVPVGSDEQENNLFQEYTLDA